jgi:thiamine pyrophosphate-dependent acetolactate synthase large subunit-like protein
VIEQADCVLVFGASLNQRTSSYGTAIPMGVPLIQIDALRTHIGRWHHADIGIVADARRGAEQLQELLAPQPVLGSGFHTKELRLSLADFDPATDFQAAPTARTMDPRSLMAELDRLLPRERSVVWDSGNFLGTVPFITAASPQRFKMTSDFASVGLGFGTALGFAAAIRDSTTVLVIGDGGLLMSLGELETAAREELPLVIVTMNDSAYGAEMHYLKSQNMPIGKTVFADVDFAPIAEALGFQALTIRSLNDVRMNAELIASPNGPLFLDCKINAAVPAAFIGEGARAKYV